MSPFGALPNALLFAVAGLVIFAAAAALLIQLIRNTLWVQATERGDTAAAIVVGALLLGVAYIVASAVH